MAITPGMKVFGFERKEDKVEVVVDLYGGENNAFGSVTFQFSSLRDMDRNVELLKRWMDEERLVDLVRDERHIALRVVG